ncbi:Uncharacterised protein [Sebaldella termitidis]|uniref:Uncharacterized protein n=1 Tax=Sebaldella termitidis (strain ATCC 33386 / NCTC 11300) TaxID=526218 RepID=D1AGN4_SEBTE|nr:hypothetical protein [Sebaldella termitidis]ACZ10754.1 hypothetical protein Sterm_3921 [Sebaldella termitidis ATCC 33386]SUI26097.1 Uncharacterised protein [Sebaldella termitidis]
MFAIIAGSVFIGFAGVAKFGEYKKNKRKRILKDQKLKADSEFSEKYNIKVLY